MKITKIEFIAHQLKRKVRWQTANYSADSLQVFFVKIHCDTGLTGIGAASIMLPQAATFAPGMAALKAAMQILFIGREVEIASLMNALDQQVPDGGAAGACRRHCWYGRRYSCGQTVGSGRPIDQFAPECL
jgi:L-alanine-DL-glutamate epimerase-like enolase superfamily enzyme